MASHLRTLCVLIIVLCLVPPVFCYNSSKIPLYIGGMMSMTGGWDGSGCLVSAELALEQINNRSDILPDYELKMVWNDSQCIGNTGARILFHHIYSKPQKIIVLSPPCSPNALSVASASRYWNLINIVYGALSPDLADREKYPNVYRVVPIATKIFNEVYIWLMKTYGWRKIGFLTHSSEANIKAQNVFIEQVKPLNATIIPEHINDIAENQVENLKSQDVRILFSIVYEAQTRLIFCESYKSGYYGPHIVWVIPFWYRPNWWLIEDDSVNCTAEELQEVIYATTVLAVEVPLISPLEKATISGLTPIGFVEEMKRRLTWPKYQAYTFNSYTAYSYDAIWTIGLLLNRSAGIMQESSSPKRLEDFTYTDVDLYQLFLDGLSTTDFFGASGQVTFEKGERLGGSELFQLQIKCPPGWFLYSRYCFQLFNNGTVDWSKAVTSCTKEAADLVDFSIEGEVSFLSRKWMTHWHDLQTLNQSKSSISPGTTSVWIRDESRECTYVDFEIGNELHRGDCSKKRAYMCKVKAAIVAVSLAIYTSGTDEIIWKTPIEWAGGEVPLDSPITVPITTDRIERLIPAYLHILVTTFSSFGAVIILITTLLTIRFIRRGSRLGMDAVFDYITLFGGFLMYASVLCTKSDLLPSLSDQHHLLICKIHDIIASLGFTMAVSTLVARILLVYNSLKSDDHAGSSVLKIGGIVAVLLTFDVICLVLKIFLYPVYLNFVPLGIEVDPEDSNHFIEYYFSECSSGDGVIPLLLSFADKAVMLLTGSFLSYEITQANLTPVGDSKQVAICIYNIILFGVCGLILTILLKNTPTESYIFASSLVICCTTVTILVLYLPKIIYWVKNRKMDENHKSRNSQCTSSTTDVSSGTASTNENLRGKVPKELLDENIKLKEEYEQLQQMALQGTRETTAGGSNKMLTGY
ncbi:gamma-aminobutyric acid type B receptor subunit 1-like [Apostichopus japonicus]|uniref:gamma-aminobutyric acid type B receptor subunit 1-like n=1 Tax=Stichopus japonicus TaxID=307972 RepID=UPI003AB74B42